MPPPVRQRYNAKARQATAGGSTHKKRRKNKESNDARDSVLEQEAISFDSNAETSPDLGQRRTAQELRKEIVSEDRAMSSKKRKRLDNYIAKKLKAESRLKSLAILAKHALPAQASSSLKSTSTLGQNPLNPLSAQERAAKREDLTVRRGLDKQGSRASLAFAGDEEDSQDEEMEERNLPNETERQKARRLQEEKRRLRNGIIEEGSIPDDAAEKRPSISKINGNTNGSSGTGKAKWSSGLIGTQPLSDSSDFDSSDSENDEDDADNAMTSQQEDQAAKELAGADVTARDQSSTDKAEAPSASVADTKLPTIIPSGALGSALARDANGNVIGPKVVVRTKTRPRISRFARRDMAQVASDSSSDSEDNSDGTSSSGQSEQESEDDGPREGDSDSGTTEDTESSEGEEENPENNLESDAVAESSKAAMFKAWAVQQTAHAIAPDLLAQNRTFDDTAAGPSLPRIGPLGGQFTVPSTSLLDQSRSQARPTIKRRPSVDESRQQLPVVAEEQSIMEAITLHPVVIICGETGSGKTTQVPQMLYEAGYGFPGSENPGMIAVTQPRRVAAVSLAVRVADELNFSKKSSVVAHQIRYQSTSSPDTAIKFMTDGVLLRELAHDFLLKRYSVVIVDEAHERGVNTDVLIGVLSRVAKLREKMWREKKGPTPLRIVIMSATLRVSDFAENRTLFEQSPPVIHVGARQHPVTVHFNRRTTNDYLTEAYKKVCKIHARLPPGGILVFLTGQSEILSLCRKLERKYGRKAIEARKQSQAPDKWSARQIAAKAWEEELEVQEIRQNDELEVEDLDLGLEVDLAGDVDDGIPAEDPDALDTDEEDAADEALGIDKEESEVPLHILPLYSLLSNEQQLKVFQPPPEGSRLVIVATNVAETSVTIPGIRYVVDCGRSKERFYDAGTGVQSFQVSWISKASASQRAGRAGRTGPGHCYRLYSSALFEDHFEAFSQPEILRMPIDGVVLNMKAMNIDAVVNFPFPTPPDRRGLLSAENLLTHLGALEPQTSTRMVNGVETKGSAGGKITELGHAMANFPVTPRFAKMLVIGRQHGCLPFVIAIVAVLSVGDPFLREEAIGQNPDEEDAEEDLTKDIPEMGHIRSAEIREKEERRARRRAFFKSQSQWSALGGGNSDLFKMLAVVGAYEYAGANADFCQKNFVREKAMKEIHQLRIQLTHLAQSHLAPDLTWDPKLKPPTSTQLKVIRQVLCAGYIDQVAVRKDLVDKARSHGNYESARGIPYKATGVPEDVYVHPSSTSYSTSIGAADFVVFGEIVRTSKIWIKNVTKINPAWLSTLGKTRCTFSKPLDMPSQLSGGSSKGGAMTAGSDTREVFVVPHFADLGVDLPAIKVTQKRIAGGRWTTEI